MSGLKRKPLPDDLNAALRGHAAALPSATSGPEEQQRGRGGGSTASTQDRAGQYLRYRGPCTDHRDRSGESRKHQAVHRAADAGCGI